MTDFAARRAEIIEYWRSVVNAPNTVDRSWISGVWTRYTRPIITADHVPPNWRFDLNPATNPHLLERLGINVAFNSGAIFWNGKFRLVVRTEGLDRKSFFAWAESDNGIDGFRFIDEPILLPENTPRDANVYDMRLTQHADGWIYGIYCSERKDPNAKPHDQSSAVAAAAMVRTKDLKKWERLPDLKTPSPQQRNVVLHPEFVDGKYMLYTRPMDGFIDTGSGSGICYGLCADMTKPVIEKEAIVEDRRYHTVSEVKNGQGPAPIKTKEGWLHLVHGVRNTAAGLRYVLYMFMTDLQQPWKLIARPAGHVLAPRDSERVGDVSNVLFSNGWIQRGEDVYLYYASSDTRMHVATSTVEKLVDYCKNTPADPLFSNDCVKQRIDLIRKNAAFWTEPA